jgi:hypothetical protein
MASTCATNATNQQERIAFIKKQIEEEEHKTLLALQAETRQAHEDYKNTFDKLMKSTNGQILNRLQIFPTIVTHLSQSIANRNVNDYVFASSSAIKGLLMTSLQTVMMGIEDLYEQGEMFLSGDELEKFRFSKKEKDAELERHRLEIQAMVDRIMFLEAQLADVEEKSRKKNVSEKNSFVKVRILSGLGKRNAADIQQETKGDQPCRITRRLRGGRDQTRGPHYLSPPKPVQLHVLSIREAGRFRQPNDEATPRCPWQN